VKVKKGAIMPILTGAIAYRALATDEVERQIRVWQKVYNRESNGTSQEVLCPKCGTAFSLLEELDATDDVLKEDLEFLAKAIRSSHPYHPDHMIIRDPSGLLFGHFEQRRHSEVQNNRTGP
jgi:hypothetical protein